jgi:hypothetical protein
VYLNYPLSGTPLVTLPGNIITKYQLKSKSGHAFQDIPALGIILITE